MANRPKLTPELRGEKVLEYIACRGPIRHRWDIIPSSPAQRPGFGTLVLLRCESCGTLRYDIFSRVTGDLLTRWYDYPDGYQDAERHTSSWWRLAWVQELYPVRPDAFLDGEDMTATRGAKKAPAPPPPIKRPAKKAAAKAAPRRYRKGVQS